mmetsp:Transcript_117583/g.327461  ORF Transcript_117583/g.327461 Transcript_117583/m.327461 type:complete len:208 (+) Transcript_117583:1252-1875(+)
MSWTPYTTVLIGFSVCEASFRADSSTASKKSRRSGLARSLCGATGALLLLLLLPPPLLPASAKLDWLRRRCRGWAINASVSGFPGSLSSASIRRRGKSSNTNRPLPSRVNGSTSSTPWVSRPPSCLRSSASSSDQGRTMPTCEKRSRGCRKRGRMRRRFMHAVSGVAAAAMPEPTSENAWPSFEMGFTNVPATPLPTPAKNPPMPAF